MTLVVMGFQGSGLYLYPVVWTCHTSPQVIPVRYALHCATPDKRLLGYPLYDGSRMTNHSLGLNNIRRQGNTPE